MLITFFLYKVEHSNLICTKFHCSWTNTFCLRPGGINYTRRHFLGTVSLWTLSRHRQGKNFKTDSKRVAVELWSAEVPLATIRKQLKMSESTLRRILTSWRRPSSRSGARGQRKQIFCRTWWSQCRQGSRRGLTGMEAKPNTKLIVKKRNINIFNFYTLLSLLFWRTGQYFLRIL
jgi:hypothetical protein